MLIPFKEITEKRKGYPCTAFRWVFKIERDFIGFIHQHQLEGKWYDSHTMVNGIFYNGHWLWGIDHFYYDGPHCIFSIGPMRFQWYNDHCKKCYGED